MDQDKNITTASIEGEVENVSANDIKEEQEATVTEHKKKNKRNNDKAKISKAAKANAQPIEKEKKRKQKNCWKKWNYYRKSKKLNKSVIK